MQVYTWHVENHNQILGKLTKNFYICNTKLCVLYIFISILEIIVITPSYSTNFSVCDYFMLLFSKVLKHTIMNQTVFLYIITGNSFLEQKLIFREIKKRKHYRDKMKKRREEKQRHRESCWMIIVKELKNERRVILMDLRHL